MNWSLYFMVTCRTCIWSANILKCKWNQISLHSISILSISIVLWFNFWDTATKNYSLKLNVLIIYYINCHIHWKIWTHAICIICEFCGTYITPRRWALLEVLLLVQILKDFPTFYGTTRFCDVYKTADQLEPTLSQINKFRITPCPLRHSVILSRLWRKYSRRSDWWLDLLDTSRNSAQMQLAGTCCT